MKTYDHGFDLARLRTQLDAEEWEDSDDSDSQVRRVYLGTVFTLTPSGKFYMPFACSNVAGCHTCAGTGIVTPKTKRRVLKRHATRHARVMRRFDRLYGKAPAQYAHNTDDRKGLPSMGKAYRPINKRAAFAFIDRQPGRYRMRYLSTGASCMACGGNGSREAHLDELWRESTEAALASIGVSLANGEGDPCDLFAEEYRDKPDSDDSDSDVDTLENAAT